MRRISPRSVRPWFKAADYSEPFKFNFLIWSKGSRVDMSCLCGLHADSHRLSSHDSTRLIILSWSNSELELGVKNRLSFLDQFLHSSWESSKPFLGAANVIFRPVICQVSMLCWKRLLEHQLNMDILFVICGITRISILRIIFLWYLIAIVDFKENRTWSESFSLDLSDDCNILWKLCDLILWLRLFPYIFVNVFLLIYFCSAYVIRLFGQFSRVLDPALDTIVY